jgi:short-subunit dehydrogenase
MNSQDTPQQQPSHEAIDNGNPAIFKPKWLVLDDANVDLICETLASTAVLSVFFFGVPSIPIIASVGGVAILVLRSFFPRSQPPKGLVLITGASSGIGAELSYIFAEKGHNLILVGRSEEQLKAVKQNVYEKYGASAEAIALDLSVSGSAKRLYDQVTREKYMVDVLINNAGLGGAGSTIEQPVELTERMTTLNCITPVQLSQLFGKDMARRGRGWILQVSSVGGESLSFNSLKWLALLTTRAVGWIASPGQNIYHASKHYVRAFSEALSMELRAYPGVINTQLMPGPTHTQWVTRAHADELFMTGASGTVEDPKSVAKAGYNGLCRGKYMVFSSWNAAFTAFLLHLAPRNIHLTIGSLMNAPLRGMAKMNQPEKDQNTRGEYLKPKIN